MFPDATNSAPYNRACLYSNSFQPIRNEYDLETETLELVVQRDSGVCFCRSDAETLSRSNMAMQWSRRWAVEAQWVDRVDKNETAVDTVSEYQGSRSLFNGSSNDVVVTGTPAAKRRKLAIASRYETTTPTSSK